MRVLLTILLGVFALGSENKTIRSVDGRLRTFQEDVVIRNDADTNRKCHQSNANYIPSLKPGQYVKNAFHNCFRTSTQIYEFVDAIVAQNPKLLTKFAISKTVKGATIYGYKLSKGDNSQSLYFQAMQHAREWVAGSSILYSFSAILDDISAGKETAADLFNLYFVPIVNIDGYEIAWNNDRYQRKNANGVDLNRNWPSLPNPRPPPPSDETYPGLKPFSEAESKGIDEWLKSHRDEIQGYIDIHTYGGLLLYPFGDTKDQIGNGMDSKFQTLGTNLQKAMGSYKPQPAYKLYLAYGCFADYVYREFKKPSITFEIVGQDFAAPASTILTRGKEVYNGINQFAKEVILFTGKTPSPTNFRTTKPVTTRPSPIPECETCSACYYSALTMCLDDFTKDDCDYYSADYGTVWCPADGI